ncbi:hypothetical protein OG417_40605 [Actinoallomurus sp. NBC_01490]|uniref:hypothetical protein n=1 Tax=Actinoallomurus sp. NBC_01490 TaxID=2903557 RepID=UPI002E37FDAB|nr:hypothetical protein [Actinoallomurus sp. NBC_01490]
MADQNAKRRAGCVGCSIVAVAVVLTLYISALQTVASAVLPISLAFVFPAAAVRRYGRRRGHFPVGLAVVAGVAALGTALSLFALLGLAVRYGDEANYDRKYGTPVTVHYQFGRCRYTVTVHTHKPSDPDCGGATWTSKDGHVHSGTLKLSWTDYEKAGPSGTIRGYAGHGSRVYTEHKASAVSTPWVYLGRIPLWTILPGVPAAVLGWLALVLSGRKEEKAGGTASPVRAPAPAAHPVPDSAPEHATDADFERLAREQGWTARPPIGSMTRAADWFGRPLGLLQGHLDGRQFVVSRYARTTQITVLLPRSLPDLDVDGRNDGQPRITGGAGLGEPVLRQIRDVARRGNTTKLWIRKNGLHHTYAGALGPGAVVERLREAVALAGTLSAEPFKETPPG